MRLFFKPQQRLSQRQEKLAGKIAGKLLSCQRMAADFLNRKTAGLHPKTWLFLLVVFCAGFGAYLIRLILGLFN